MDHGQAIGGGIDLGLAACRCVGVRRGLGLRCGDGQRGQRLGGRQRKHGVGNVWFTTFHQVSRINR